MALKFQAHCPDCQHQWEGIEVSYRIGPGTDIEKNNIQELFCPGCYARVLFPRTVERKSWQRWHERFQSTKEQRSKLLTYIAAQVDAALASARWFAPTDLQIVSVECPECKLQLEAGSQTANHLICPRCRSQAPLLAEYEGFIEVAGEWGS
jgi:Zn finger protein HypA/HybF involved in hydrogenase expression